MKSKKLLEALNQQIQMEGESFTLYLAAANWCEYKGYRGTAHFLFVQAEEEKEHMMKIVRFLHELGEFPRIPGLAEPPAEFPSYRAVFEKAYAHEQKVTQSIHQMVELALSEKDFATFNFLQWFVQEQVEEENLFKSILDKLDMIGEEGRVLYLLDKELGERQK